MVSQSIMFGLPVTEWIIRCDEITLFQAFEDFTRPTTILNVREFKDFFARVAVSSSRQQTNNLFSCHIDFISLQRHKKYYFQRIKAFYFSKSCFFIRV